MLTKPTMKILIPLIRLIALPAAPGAEEDFEGGVDDQEDQEFALSADEGEPPERRVSLAICCPFGCP